MQISKATGRIGSIEGDICSAQPRSNRCHPPNFQHCGRIGLDNGASWSLNQSLNEWVSKWWMEHKAKANAQQGKSLQCDAKVLQRNVGQCNAKPNRSVSFSSECKVRASVWAAFSSSTLSGTSRRGEKSNGPTKITTQKQNRTSQTQQTDQPTTNQWIDDGHRKQAIARSMKTTAKWTESSLEAERKNALEVNECCHERASEIMSNVSGGRVWTKLVKGHIRRRVRKSKKDTNLYEEEAHLWMYWRYCACK